MEPAHMVRRSSDWAREQIADPALQNLVGRQPDRVGLERLLRHEYGHCNGLIHPDGKLDKWREVVGSEREKIAALVHRQWLEITGRREVAPARNAESATAAPPLKPRRDVALRAPRAFSGEGY
jgi:hypothetical protein